MSRTCRHIRELASADLDGEATPAESALVRTHLEDCAECRDWSRAAWSIGARAARAPLGTPPDLSAAVLAARTAPPSRTPTDVLLARTTLVSLGLVHLWWTLASGLGDAGHPGRDVGAFDIALGLAVLAVAAQPWRAAGMLPMLAALSVLLVGLGVSDLVGGRTTLAQEALHLLVPVELVVVTWLRRRTSARGPVTPPPVGLRPRRWQEDRAA